MYIYNAKLIRPVKIIPETALKIVKLFYLVLDSLKASFIVNNNMIVNSVFLTETEPGGAILTIKVYSILFAYNKLVIELIGTPYKHLVYDMLISNIYPTSSPSGHWFTCFLGFPLILSSKTLWKLFLFSLVVNLLGNIYFSP